MIQKERIKCPICDCKHHELVSKKGRDYITTYTSICTDCGFLFQNPRWSKEKIVTFYKRNYDLLYRAKVGINRMSLAEYEEYPYGYSPIYQRINDYLPIKIPNKTILDIGSGDGTNLDYIGKKFNTKNLFAIEPSLKGQIALKNRGIDLITADVDTDWDVTYNKFFDLVILRHVLEHLHYTNEFLSKVRKTLKAGGLMYIAVPNAFNIGKDWLQRGFFRIVHNYYFSSKSLSDLLKKNGFEIINIVEGDKYHSSELYAVIRPGVKSKPIISKSDYNKQLSFLSSTISHEDKYTTEIKAFFTYVKRITHLVKVKLKALALLSKP